MSLITPIVGIDFDSAKPISLELDMRPIDTEVGHPEYPNGKREYHAHAPTGRITLGAIGVGEDSLIVISHPWEKSVVEERARFAGGSGLHAVLYLAGVDPESLSLDSEFELRRQEGQFRRQTCFQVERWEEFTHKFVVYTPLLGGVSIFATKEKSFGPKRGELELKY